MSVLTFDNNSITGLALISDSLDITISAGSFTKGLNNFIIYTCNYIERYLIVECRSKTTAESFLSSAKPGNAITSNVFTGTYYVKEAPTLVENFGETGGQWSGASWKYNLTLVREE
jgi:hypothetical protein